MKILKNKLFPPNGDINIWDKILIDNETVSYISLPDDADKITKIIEQHCMECGIKSNDLIITDATAGAGGNVISFSKTFKTVNAIEIDTQRYYFLTNNIEVYKIKNVKHYCDDCLNLIFQIYQDIIFFDPPWGGKDYKDKNKLRLKLGNQHLENICLELMDENKTKFIPKIIALKLPKNYDLKYLYDCLNNDNVKLTLYTLNKMNIIIIHVNKISSN